MMKFLWITLFIMALALCIASSVAVHRGEQFNKLVDDGKCGWKWAEWFFGAYLGLIITIL